MKGEQKIVVLEDIIQSMRYASSSDKEIVRRAYAVAEKAHEGQLRKSGEPYITHPAAIGEMLARIGVGARTIAAGILHDTIEDTSLTADDIRQEFDDEILFLVEGVTKLGSVRYHGRDRHNESLRRLFVATSRDIRVLIIKLVDRLHNMQTLEYVRPDKQLRIARETLEIYVPVAYRLGMGKIRKELEDLAFPYVYPEDHERVSAMVKSIRKNSDEILEKCRKSLQKQLAEMRITDISTSTRVKGIYSLYLKLRRRDWNMDNVFDFLAIRIIAKNMDECYHVLGIVHELWRPIPGRIKDYIALPKPNGYRSLHTTVVTPFGRTLEVQIRTEDMHRDAEFGVASHIIYKEAQQGKKPTKNESWFSSLIPSLFRPFSWKTSVPKQEIHPTPGDDAATVVPKWIKEIARSRDAEAAQDEFENDLKQDFFSQRIFVFTPKGDVVDLPRGASPVDFAYEIHSDIGNHTSGAKVNGKLVQIDSKLENGDIVEIITSKNSKPTPKWLQFTKTSAARRKIRSHLNISN